MFGFLSLLFQSPTLLGSLALSAAALLTAITIHEFAHALTADRLGDPTPRLQGRLTLNPLAHLDPIGTIMLLVAGFGWGKPVIFDPYNLENPKRDAALISIAGPASNIILASVLSLIYRIYPSAFIIPFVTLNISLAIFNLVPVHPLDGGKIIAGILPARQARIWDAILNRYGLILLLFLIFPIFGGSSIISLVISPVINLLINLYLPGVGVV